MKRTLSSLLGICSAFCIFGGEQTDFQPSRDGGWQPAVIEKNGVFTVPGKTVLRSVKKIKVDPTAKYQLSGKFKSTGTPGQRLFFGFEGLNAKGLMISSPSVQLVPESETELVEDLKKGSKTALVRDASKWKNLRLSLPVFGAKKDMSDLPNSNFGPGIAKIEKLARNWQITFRTPVKRDYSAGEIIRQHYYGAGRIYTAAAGSKLNDSEWKTFSGTIEGISPHGTPLKQWWKGTRSACIVILSEPGSIEFKDIVLCREDGKIEFCETGSVSTQKKSAAKTTPAKKNEVKPMYLSFDQAKIKELQGKYRKELEDKIRKNHPRLYFSDADFAKMAQRVKKDVRLQIMVNYLKYLADQVFPDEVTVKNYQATTKNGVVWYGNDKFGSPAARCALLYRLTGEKKYFDKAIKILRVGAKWYNECYDKRIPIDWYALSRLNALYTYDWLYNEMSEKDRAEIGNDLMRHFIQASDRNWVVKSGLHRKGEGISSWWSSFYGPPLLKFYAGLVFHDKKEGGTQARKMLWEGLNDHVQMLNYHAHMAGHDGGGNCSTLGYVSESASYCEWFFFHQWKYMTGRNIAKDFPEIGLFPHFLYYATFTGIDGKLHEHGSGSAWHTTNLCKLSKMYMLQFRCFFPDTPAEHLVDHWVRTDPAFRSDRLFMLGAYRYNTCFPHLIFLSDFVDPASKDDPSFFQTMPKAYFFQNLGQLYMYSGREKDSTYALFTCGAKSPAHKQPDENNFIIYKGGFLAMDTGTRVHTLKHDKLDYYHDANYYSASIAHNVVLIRMEGEKFSAWPHPKYAVANHAGMNKTIGGVVRAYETNDDFTYILGDSTATYHPDKCKKMFRQFVFIQPDYFVICDTVESVKPEQTQTWLLHSQKKPVEKGDIFTFDEEQGRLFCRTFLPQSFKRTVIGGKGKDFYVDGKNFNNIDPDYMVKLAKQGIPDPKWGNYRVELTAGKTTAKVRFLNLIQVGMKAKLQKMMPSEYVNERDLEGVRFTSVDGTVWTVLFDQTGLKGKIRAEKTGRTLVERALTEKIQEQKAFQK